jgi:hypothetical protein
MTEVGFVGKTTAERAVAKLQEQLQQRWSNIEPREYGNGQYEPARRDLIVADLRYIAENELPRLVRSSMFEELHEQITFIRGALVGACFLSKKEAELIGVPTPETANLRKAV